MFQNHNIVNSLVYLCICLSISYKHFKYTSELIDYAIKYGILSYFNVIIISGKEKVGRRCGIQKLCSVRTGEETKHIHQ